MSEHTEEPWEVDENGWSTGADLHENQPRIVALWNTFQGIPTERLAEFTALAAAAADILVDIAHGVQVTAESRCWQALNSALANLERPA